MAFKHRSPGSCLSWTTSSTFFKQQAALTLSDPLTWCKIVVSFLINIASSHPPPPQIFHLQIVPRVFRYLQPYFVESEQVWYFPAAARKIATETEYFRRNVNINDICKANWFKTSTCEWNKCNYLDPPEASDCPYTCHLKAGHAGMTSWISQLLPNFIMLLDALANANLGLRKSKDGDKAKPITFIFIFLSSLIFFQKWGNNSL